MNDFSSSTSSQTTSWFEFLLNPNLLDTFLTAENLGKRRFEKFLRFGINFSFVQNRKCRNRFDYSIFDQRKFDRTKVETKRIERKSEFDETTVFFYEKLFSPSFFFFRRRRTKREPDPRASTFGDENRG